MQSIQPAKTSMDERRASTVLQSCQNVIDCAIETVDNLEPDSKQYASAHAHLTSLSLHAEHALAVLRQSQTEFKADTSSTTEKAEGLAGESTATLVVIEAGHKGYLNELHSQAA